MYNGRGLLATILDVVRGGLGGWRYAKSDEDWAIPDPSDLEAIGSLGRDILMLQGLQALGIRGAQNELLASVGTAIDDLSNLVRGYIQSGGNVPPLLMNAGPGPLNTSLPVGSLVRETDSQFVFAVVRPGVLSWITTPEEVVRRGGNVQVLPDGALNGTYRLSENNAR